MGWGRMMLLGDVGQQLDISDMERAIGQMRADYERKRETDRRQERDIDKLERENHELKLYVATLVRLLVAKGVVQQQEVDAAVRAIEK